MLGIRALRTLCTECVTGRGSLNNCQEVTEFSAELLLPSSKSELNVECVQHTSNDFQPDKTFILLSKELQKWRSPEYYENNVHKMQLPFSNKLLGSTLTSEEKQERRQQQLRRLQELNARRREEKLQLDQERLDRLLYVQVFKTKFSV